MGCVGTNNQRCTRFWLKTEKPSRSNVIAMVLHLWHRGLLVVTLELGVWLVYYWCSHELRLCLTPVLSIYWVVWGYTVTKGTLFSFRRRQWRIGGVCQLLWIIEYFMTLAGWLVDMSTVACPKEGPHLEISNNNVVRQNSSFFFFSVSGPSTSKCQSNGIFPMASHSRCFLIC